MTDENKHYVNINVSEDGDATVTITGEVPYETIKSYRDDIISKAKETVEVDGFRKGNAPEHAVLEKLGGEENVLYEAAEKALGVAYPQILREKDIDAIGRPQVSLTKLAPENPVGFKITTATMPDVTLPDYKTLAKGALAEPAEDTAVTDEEIEQVIEQVRQSRAKQPEQSTEESGNTTLYDADGNPVSGGKQEEQEPELPELTDEFVQSLGDFKTVDDFKKKIKENMQTEKQQKAREKQRVAVAEKIIEAADIELPAVITDHELDKMLAQFKQDVERMGMQFEQYLTQAGKSEEELRTEWRPEAEKRGKLQIILNKIAEKENLTPSEEEVNQQVEHILEQYPDADREAARSYVATQLANENVFQMLEKQAPEQDANEKKDDK